jgi:murein DD-endopeptidase MepM/ murein hydrolase activator NlpD
MMCNKAQLHAILQTFESSFTWAFLCIQKPLRSNPIGFDKALAVCLMLVFGSLSMSCAAAGGPPITSTASPLLLTAPARASTTPSLGVASPIATSTTTLLPTPTPSPIVTNICSPLENESLAALADPDLLKNPFVAPRPGYDDGHPGIDLAYWTDPQGRPMLGLGVHAALAGTIAGVIANRYPYGNAIIIETPLTAFPQNWLTALALPTPALRLQPSYSISCPDYPPEIDVIQSKSLYLLYAHLEETPSMKTGNRVLCGEQIGKVGTTGKSVNPHLHFETRIGPAGITIASMAHYDASASENERRAYCYWRISGEFPPFNPLNLFRLTQQDR